MAYKYICPECGESPKLNIASGRLLTKIQQHYKKEHPDKKPPTAVAMRMPR